MFAVAVLCSASEALSINQVNHQTDACLEFDPDLLAQVGQQDEMATEIIQVQKG